MNEPPIIIESEFVSHSLELYDVLSNGIAWDERMRARKTASFGTVYNYSGITYPAVPMHPLLIPIVDKLETLLGFRPNNCLLNFYESGEASMGFHSDSTEELAPNTGVAIISLGAGRSITFQSKQDRQIQYSYLLESGSLLYMSAEIQHQWKHAILKQDEMSGRISLTFRQMKSE